MQLCHEENGVSAGMINMTLKKGLWAFVQTHERALRDSLAAASFAPRPPPPPRAAALRPSGLAAASSRYPPLRNRPPRRRARAPAVAQSNQFYSKTKPSSRVSSAHTTRQANSERSNSRATCGSRIERQTSRSPRRRRYQRGDRRRMIALAVWTSRYTSRYTLSARVGGGKLPLITIYH